MLSSMSCITRPPLRFLQYQGRKISVSATASRSTSEIQRRYADPAPMSQQLSFFPFARTLSTVPEVVTAQSSASNMDEKQHEDEIAPEDLVNAELIEILMNNPKKKLRPSVTRKRLEKLRVYEGKERNIRGSPWKLNLVCQFAAGQTVPEALTQLKFLNKAKAPLVARVIQRTSNLADIRDNLLPCQLEVAECFSTHGTPLKRIRYHSKGRFGKMSRRFSHMNVKLRELDFDFKIAQSRTRGEIQRWVMRKAEALREVAEAKRLRSETEDLERQYAALEAKKKREEEEAGNKR